MIKEIELKGYGRDICSPTKARTTVISLSNMIHFIDNGCGYFNGRLLHAGQGFVCRKDVLCDYLPSKEEPWSYFWINVVGSGADSLISSICDDDGIFTLPDNIDILNTLMPRSNSPTDELRVISILLDVLSRTEQKQSLHKTYAQQASELFENFVSSGITVQEAAKRLNISRAYLRNVFFDEMGVSPQKYLIDLKMKRAEFLLKKTYSITEIANAIGYSDVLQFSRIFKKYHGLSPENYRKEYL